MDENALAAGFAVIAASTEPADRDSITHREFPDPGTEFGYGPGNFVPRGQWPRYVREAAVHEGAIGAANAARADRYPYFVPTRGRCFDVGKLQGPARGLYADGLMSRHPVSLMRDRAFRAPVIVVVDLPVLDAVEPTRP